MRLDFGRPRAVVLGALLVCGVPCACQKATRAAGRLQARIVDDATGAPLSARVAITDADGKPVEIDRAHEHVQQLGKRWYYVDGAFTASLPGPVTVEIRRGLETRPLAENVSGVGPEKPVTKMFRLRRWTDMRAKGYVSGDLHAHVPALDDAAQEMRAEDLNALNLLIVGGMPEPNDKAFKGRLDERSTPGCEIYLNQEVMDWQLGHLTLAGLTRLVPGYPVPGGTLDYGLDNPHRDILRAARVTRAQNGFVSLAHFENLPGAESPVAVALGLLDAVELPTWADPMQLPAHLGPWDNSGLPTAEFTPMRGVDLYYQFLNAGFRLPIAAGTDKVGDDIPLGSNRTYIATKGAGGYAAWLAGIKAGTGFVTNGPIIEFDVDGRAPGDTIEFQGTKTITAHAVARSILPFTTIEILANGRRVARKLILVQRNPPVDGVYTIEVAATVSLSQSSWLAARAFANPDVTPRLLPRDSSVFSHTDPVYFLREGRKVREEASVEYLRKYVRGLLHWLSTRPAFASEQDRAAVQRDAEEALRIYEAL